MDGRPAAGRPAENVTEEKLQIPNSKLQRTLKLQTSKRAALASF